MTTLSKAELDAVTEALAEFQYPEGFWPDSDTVLAVIGVFGVLAAFTPVSVPRRVLAR